MSPGAGPAGAGATPVGTTPQEEIAARRRAMIALFVTATLMNAAMAAVAPTSTIYAEPYVGLMWSAFPQTLTILGTGIGALVTVRASTRLGWRSSLILAFVIGTLGGVLTFGATLIESISLLDIGMFVLGLGVGGSIVSRYAAAELYPSNRRGYAIGVVVAAGAVGSVGGPLLLAPMSDLMERAGWPALSGPFLLATVVCAIAGILAFIVPPQPQRPAAPKSAALRTVFQSSSARMMLTVMIVSQVIMVAIMTAAPMDILYKDGNLVIVGTALAAHAGGMFFLSPLVGWVIDRVGSRKVMYSGLVVLTASAVLGATTPMSHSLFSGSNISLFLLGLGWNLCFMAGSRTLATTLAEGGKGGQVVGAVDAVVWGVSATGTLGGTAVLSIGGYAMLAQITGVLTIITFLFLLRSRPVAAVRNDADASAEPRPEPVPEQTDKAA